MVVAVVAVGVVQVAGHQVIGVVAVRHGFMTAARSVLVPLLVLAAVVRRRAARGVGCVDGELVLLDLVAVDVMEVAVVEVIDVAIVPDAGVATVGPVPMLVSRVCARH